MKRCFMIIVNPQLLVFHAATYYNFNFLISRQVEMGPGRPRNIHLGGL